MAVLPLQNWGSDVQYKCTACSGGARCPQCKKWYKNSSSLAAHRSQDCGKGAQYQCSVCSSKFTRKYSLKMHLFSVHKKPTQ
ncbi:hypothetical protein MTP99_008524 [Tenebrio molitor]|nr:hypothetical protein MTP99_008524 [Tenebrio molitor]CAH1367275.1 unnamed protein product [Tenebrio molitor]